MPTGSTTNIGINGFGRIGRQVLRASLANSDLRVVAVNDPFLDVEAAANAIRFDSAAGRFRGSVEVRAKDIIVDGRRIAFTSIADPTQIPWSEHDVAYVLECSGVYTTAERAASHLAGGAQRVIIGTVSADAPPLVLGANEDTFKPSMQVVSASSSVTVAASPVLKALSTSFGVESCTFTCLHAATAGKATDSTNVKDPRGARATLGNVAPVNLAHDVKAIGRVLPRLNGRVSGMTVRVPTTVGSMLDMVVTLKEPTSLARVVEALEATQVEPPAAGAEAATPNAPTSPTRGGEDAAGSPARSTARTQQKSAPLSIVGVTRDPVVSGDFAGEQRSAVLDVKASIAIPPAPADGSPAAVGPSSVNPNGGAQEEQLDCKTFKLVLWFDNERGYAQRLLDIVAHTSASW